MQWKKKKLCGYVISFNNIRFSYSINYMTNDVLEQLVEDYLRSEGYFTQHNVKFRPNQDKIERNNRNQFSVHSDIDVVAIHPKKIGLDKVIVVSCKSWQGGLNLKSLDKMNNLYERQDYKSREIKIFKDLFHPIWTEALIDKVFQLTGRRTFIFYLALTRYIGKKKDVVMWEDNYVFKKNLPGCMVKIIDFKHMLEGVNDLIGLTPEHGELGRTLQLIKASGGKVLYRVDSI